MGIIEKLNAIKGNVPHYWPIGSFIHHNPLKGFEHFGFKDGLNRAKKIYGGKVYMEPSYYLKFYNEGKISHSILEENLKEVLEVDGLAEHYDLAMKCLLEVNPQWNHFRKQADDKEHPIDKELLAYLDDEFSYHNKERWLKQITKHMTLYEINDILFHRDDKEVIEKSIIEYITRFLDEDQTTIPMENRELGMFETFKLFEDFDYPLDSEAFVEEALERLHVKNKERYLLTHVLKLHGWAGFIKYRSEDPGYFSQQKNPSSLMDYMAIRLYYELAYLQHRKINNFDLLHDYSLANASYVVLKMLKYNYKLPGKYIDLMEDSNNFDDILERYVQEELQLDAKQVHLSNDLLNNTDIPLVELAKIMEVLREEEGYIWMKSLEDTYIHSFIDEMKLDDEPETERPLASITMCLDVRSETTRRAIESTGNYTTFGAGGFLGFPIAFVEFDKTNEQLLCPAVVKPGNIVFEIAKDVNDEYKSKKTINKTTKKVISDLKNNPYTPYIMVEAIGWVFGINLFGKTFAPQKTKKFFANFKAKKPKTTYTLDKLSDEDIEMYVNRLHLHLIHEALVNYSSKSYTEEDIQAIRDHLVLGSSLSLDMPSELLNQLKKNYNVSPEDYELQKIKLAKVGFTLEEKVEYLYKFLTMIGQVDNFAEFVILSGHVSVSDNNPFESALDCGACGGKSSLPNNRALCMLANSQEVRDGLAKRGLVIPDDVKFIPSLHITTTDEIEFHDRYFNTRRDEKV